MNTYIKDNHIKKLYSIWNIPHPVFSLYVPVGKSAGKQCWLSPGAEVDIFTPFHLFCPHGSYIKPTIMALEYVFM